LSQINTSTTGVISSLSSLVIHLEMFNPFSAEFKNGMFQFWISTHSIWHIRGFLAKIWKYDKQCSPWWEGSSRSPLIWVYTVNKRYINSFPALYGLSTSLRQLLVQTLIKLLLKEQFDQSLNCLPKYLMANISAYIRSTIQ